MAANFDKMFEKLNGAFGREMTLRRRIPGEVDPATMIEGQDSYDAVVVVGRRRDDRGGSVGGDRFERIVQFAISRKQVGVAGNIEIEPGDQIKDGDEYFTIATVVVEANGLDLIVSGAAAKPGSVGEKAGT